MALLRLSRAEFLDGYFDYNPGEHLAVIEPTGGGKTWLIYQLLDEAMKQNPHLRVMSAMPKAADATTAAWARTLGLRETPVWPPAPKLFASKPRGYVLWPKHDMSVTPTERRAKIGAVLRAGLNDQYVKGNSITFVDDAHSAATMMGLNEYVEELLVNGRSNGAAAWLTLQAPKGSAATGSITGFVYSSVRHLFLGKDTEERNVQRMAEIGAFDAKETAAIVRDLRLYSVNGQTVSEKLYVDKRGPYRCLVGP